ncbi:MAG: circularly permuted type 2 ATP-grasp protein [Halothiobacillaceae bacterium]
MNQDTSVSDGYWDEMLDETGEPRPAARRLWSRLRTMAPETLAERARQLDRTIMNMGITFTVYSQAGNIDRAWPLDLVPRVIPDREWTGVAEGLKQRLRALNHFIDDIYHERQIIRDGVFPAALLETSTSYRTACEGVSPRFGVWAHICGSDLVRDDQGVFHVLEDNLRVPSGVSYMVENRALMKRVFPELFSDGTILPNDDYAARLHAMLCEMSPREVENPVIAVLTPGIYNSAYFEHSYLAREMGVFLVEGADLAVDADDVVTMRTVAGPRRVDVIYRRIDDLFLDPEVFRPDSVLGVPGLMRAWRAGKVALVNAPGAGLADDKAVYTQVPRMIEYYLDEKPILPNVPSYLCMNEDERAYVLDHLDELVVKPVNESGGYGMLIGPRATEAERAEFARLIREKPRNYMAQPMLKLSTSPTWTGESLAPRHLDLRPFVLQGASQSVTTGGLTRVAMTEGSVVVNSSQGGGSKDTWIVRTTGEDRS